MITKRLYIALILALSLLAATEIAMMFLFATLALGGYCYEPNPVIAWAEFGLCCATSIFSLLCLVYLARAYNMKRHPEGKRLKKEEQR